MWTGPLLKTVESAANCVAADESRLYDHRATSETTPVDGVQSTSERREWGGERSSSRGSSRVSDAAAARNVRVDGRRGLMMARARGSDVTVVKAEEGIEGWKSPAMAMVMAAAAAVA